MASLLLGAVATKIGQSFQVFRCVLETILQPVLFLLVPSLRNRCVSSILVITNNQLW